MNSTSRKLVAALFDSSFYLRTYPDVRDAGAEPLDHYLSFGWKEGRDPSPTFKTEEYLAANPAVRDAGICPLVEYALAGAVAGQPLRPGLGADDVCRKLAEAFDASFYLDNNSDVAAASVDPLTHYLQHGWWERRNPSPVFDTAYYLEVNADVRQSGICPLVHYVTVGAAERRPTRRSRNWALEALRSAVPASERVNPSVGLSPIETVDQRALGEVLAALLASHRTGVALAFSQDDYVTVFGGVQNSVSDEEHVLVHRGWAYLHLCPAQPRPVLSPALPADRFFVRLRGNGAEIGVISMATLAKALAQLELRDRTRVMVVHHLMGFSPELIADLASVIEPDKTIIWIHDFFTLCPSYALLRNNAAFCGAPAPDSTSCGSCVYGGSERNTHLSRLGALFDRLRPTVLAPSQPALDFWVERSPLKYTAACACPHGALTMETELREFQDRLRIGFVGAPAYHKGWHVFEELASRHHDDTRYAFFHFAQHRAGPYTDINFVYTRVDGAHRHRMIDSLIANEIGVVIAWSLCFETFSFSAYEAVAAGAFVLAPNNAGNIVPAVTQRGVEQGLGLGSKDELFELFASGRIFEVARRRRYGEFHIHAAVDCFVPENSAPAQ